MISINVSARSIFKRNWHLTNFLFCLLHHDENFSLRCPVVDGENGRVRWELLLRESFRLQFPILNFDWKVWKFFDIFKAWILEWEIFSGGISHFVIKEPTNSQSFNNSLKRFQLEWSFKVNQDLVNIIWPFSSIFNSMSLILSTEIS